MAAGARSCTKFRLKVPVPRADRGAVDSTHDVGEPEIDRRREDEANRIGRLLENGALLLDDARRTLASLDEVLLESHEWVPRRS